MPKPVIEQRTAVSGTVTKRSRTPGRKPSSTTSARSQSACASAGSDFRSQTTDSLPALIASYQAGAPARIGSPSGGSTFTTRAPSRCSSRLANGPGRYQVKSATRRPASGCTPYYGQALTDRSIAQEEKRRLLLDAAVRVFARSGYNDCRVGDITQEAGVAHGLLYHYFTSKEEVLEAV